MQMDSYLNKVGILHFRHLYHFSIAYMGEELGGRKKHNSCIKNCIKKISKVEISGCPFLSSRAAISALI